ncbi:MAG: type II secretion system protein, partial [Planctomycetota bacterium]
MARSGRGFTIIELLVVILIISVLIALGLAVGARVVGGAKTTQTRDLIKTLENVLSSYETTADRTLPAFIADPRGDLTATTISSQPAFFPLADGVAGETDDFINSVGLFLHEARSVAGVSSLLDGLDTQNYQEFAYTPATELSSDPGATEPLVPTVLDAWGQPLRLVHPRFHGVVRDAVRFDDDDWLGPAPDSGIYFPERFRRDPAQGVAIGPNRVEIRSAPRRQATVGVALRRIAAEPLREIDPAVRGRA